MITRFTPYQIEECLFDKKRTSAFLAAMKKTVKKGDVVVDAGSGTGILGLYAAKLGADKVYCLESNPRFIPIIKANAKSNRLENKIEVIRGDATKIKLPEKVDLIVMEMLSTGLFFEPEIQAMNNLKKFLKQEGALIPEKYISMVQLVNAEKEIYGLRLDNDSRFHKVEGDQALTGKKVFDIVNFYEKNPNKLCVQLKITAGKSGMASAIKIYSKAYLGNGIWATKSKFLFNPLTIFLKKAMRVVKGKEYKVSISYDRGGDTLNSRNKFSIDSSINS